MTFGPNHYVPVVKVKRGEMSALQALPPSVTSNMTPLLEVVARTDKTVQEHLDSAFRYIPAAVQRTARFLIDAGEIADDGLAASDGVLARARALGRPFTPITGISRADDIATSIAAAPEGFALRVTREEFEGGSLTARLIDFMTRHSALHERVDLILDLGPVEELIPTGIARLSAQFLAAVPQITRWSTLTLVASAFPLSMKDVPKYGGAYADRAEWVAWRDALHGRRQRLARLPTYGDCGVQHPWGVEGFDPKIMPLSGKIRYALAEQWLRLKGESHKVTPLRQQFPVLAAALTTGAFSAQFAGSAHCGACYRMLQAARGAPNLGSLEVWLRLGTIHHITLASEQIRALPWP